MIIIQHKDRKLEGDYEVMIKAINPDPDNSVDESFKFTLKVKSSCPNVDLS